MFFYLKVLTDASISDRSLSLMIHSVADILLNLPDDTNVYPGHMGYTTIADEKQYNPLAGYRGREA